MSDLERELAHARRMATAEHKPECLIECRDWTGNRAFSLPGPSEPGGKTPCPGCVTDSERALWAQLAEEYQQQIDRHREDPLL